MKRFLFISMVLSAFLTTAFAQSGRKIEAPPPLQDGQVESEEQFSESKPTRLPPVYLTPAMRQELEKRKREANKKRAKKTRAVKNDPKPAEDAPADEDAILVETSLVTIPVSVFDRNGLYVSGLQKSDFKIFENGKEQEIEYFGTTDQPFTVILLLDTSFSTEYKIDEIQEAAIAFTNLLKPQDRVMVIEFDEKVHVLSEITNDRNKIHKAIRKADFGDGTSLYDAVDFSLRKRLSSIEGRKAIVLFTDGVDTTSRKNTFDSTLYQAQESDAMIFPIYYNTFENVRRSLGGISSPFPQAPLPGIGVTAEEYALGKKYLEDLALSTGGRVFHAEATPGGLTAAFEGIAEELRRQYNIGYYPQETGKPGERKEIRVRVNRPNLVVRARDSYIVGGEMGAKQ